MNKLIELLETEYNIFWVLNDQIGKHYKGMIYGKDAFLYYESKASSILLQAHIDTCRHEIEPPKAIIDGNVIRSAGGVLGADDRLGCWMILNMIGYCIDNGLPLPNILYTDHEETGGQGMDDFLKKHKDKRFKHINLAIALDRHGVGESVYYVDPPGEVTQYVKSFGWSDVNGTYSDIQAFTTRTKIPSVNLSVGYHNEHTAGETIHIDEAKFTLARLSQMIRNPIQQRYIVTIPKPNYTSWSNYQPKSGSSHIWAGHGNYDHYDKMPIGSYETEGECDYCGAFATLTKTIDHGVSCHICQTCWAYLCDQQDQNQTTLAY